MALRPVSVTQLNEYISRIISTDPLLGSVVVAGETSGIKYHSTGHVYFTLADSESRINCFLPRDYVRELSYQLEDGMEVTITGFVSVFKKNGTYSLYVKDIEISGAGDLAAAFEKLKQKLNKEGLFDKAHKKPLPEFPKKIGIVTSDTGAAVRDILKILRSRNNMTDVILFPVLVQGDGAAADIAKTIDMINDKFDDIDLLIVGRGGGSASDLWAFNEEAVARAIYASRIPIISAVGHEIDYTIADMVADVRAETPTAAAQMAVPDTAQLMDRLDEFRENLTVQLTNKLMYLSLFTGNLKSELDSQITARITSLENEIERSRLSLEANDPQKIMTKGYSIITDETGKALASVDNVDIDGSYSLIMSDGSARCVITEKNHGRNQ